MNRSLTLHLGTTTYTLSKRFMQLGHLTFSKKATYELSPSSGRHSATKRDIAGVLQANWTSSHRWKLRRRDGARVWLDAYRLIFRRIGVRRRRPSVLIRAGTSRLSTDTASVAVITLSTTVDRRLTDENGSRV